MIRRLTLIHSVPLVQDDDGTIHVAGSRVTLDTLITEFRDGATPEQIQDSFPSLSLGAIYSAIAYYLEHRDDVDAYLNGRYEAAAAARKRIETHQGTSLRERLRARRGELARH